MEALISGSNRPGDACRGCKIGEIGLPRARLRYRSGAMDTSSRVAVIVVVAPDAGEQQKCDGRECDLKAKFVKKALSPDLPFSAESVCLGGRVSGSRRVKCSRLASVGT